MLCYRFAYTTVSYRNKTTQPREATQYHIHHSLEGGGGRLQPKGKALVFPVAFFCVKNRFCSVPLRHLYLVLPHYHFFTRRILWPKWSKISVTSDNEWASPTVCSFSFRYSITNLQRFSTVASAFLETTSSGLFQEELFSVVIPPLFSSSSCLQNSSFWDSSKRYYVFAFTGSVPGCNRISCVTPVALLLTSPRKWKISW